MSGEEKKDAGEATAAKAVLLVSSLHHAKVLAAKDLLDILKVEYTELQCDDAANKDERARLWAISGKPAVYPQLFVGDEFIGDGEDLQDDHDEGELQPRLAALGVVKKA